MKLQISVIRDDGMPYVERSYALEDFIYNDGKRSHKMIQLPDDAGAIVEEIINDVERYMNEDL